VGHEETGDERKNAEKGNLGRICEPRGERETTTGETIMRKDATTKTVPSEFRKAGFQESRRPKRGIL